MTLNTVYICFPQLSNESVTKVFEHLVEETSVMWLRIVLDLKEMTLASLK